MTSPKAIIALVGRLVLLFALLMLVPLVASWTDGWRAAQEFAQAMGLTIAGGLALLLPTLRHHSEELQPRDGFLLVGITWMVLPAFGAVPLWLAIPGMGVTDAYFEAMSGFTATGATVVKGLDGLPLAVNVWRCFLNLIGGLGIVVLAVAILPLLGVGGSQLFKSEITGPMKDQKLTPRVADTARGLWVIYTLAAIACVLAYRWAGMSWSDAFMHMCSTMSLGGLSSHDQSFGFWNSPTIEMVAVFFMVLSGVNFALYFAAWRRRSVGLLWRDVELRAYLLVLVGAIALVTVYLLLHGEYPDAAETLRHAAFHVVSVATTTGYTTQDYAAWPTFLPPFLMLLGCFATCAGSTGGGIKMLRLILLLKQSQRELVRIVHPNVVNPVVLGGVTVSPRVMHSVIAFMMLYGMTLVALTMVLLLSGMDMVSAFTAVMACINNIGPGLGEVGPALNFAGLTEFQKWVLIVAMPLGRLELLSLLVLFTPQFWRR
jgi:trk system potassium uptake protein TrkH